MQKSFKMKKILENYGKKIFQNNGKTLEDFVRHSKSTFPEKKGIVQCRHSNSIQKCIFKFQAVGIVVSN